MDFQALMQNQAVIFGGVGFVLLVIGFAFGTKKRQKLGESISTKLNAIIGKKNEEKVEEILSDIVDGMKKDNGK